MITSAFVSRAGVIVTPSEPRADLVVPQAARAAISPRQRDRSLSFVPRQRNLNLQIALPKEDFS
jgi:hypothetical protein